MASRLDFWRAYWGRDVFKIRGLPGIHLRHDGRVWPIWEICVIPLTQILRIGIRIINQSQLKIIDIIDVVASVLGKKTPTWQFSVKWSIDPHISHDGGGALEFTAFTFNCSNLWIIASTLALNKLSASTSSLPPTCLGWPHSLDDWKLLSTISLIKL